MNSKLEHKLFKDYPKIFRQKDLPKTQTSMCWGLECGNGWYKLIDILCSQLQWDIDHNKEPQIEATQVKEKFGTLRFYTTGASERQNGMISFAESLCEEICEKCGSMEKVSQTEGWIQTLCEKCKEEL